MITVILSHPQMGENIGATARAMQNFGLSSLRLINPRDGWPNERANAVSSGALERMENVAVFDSLNDAVADMHYVIGTSARQRDMVKKVLSPESAAFEIAQRHDQNIAIIFGAERTGLLNDEVALCNALLTVPLNPEFSSLNLAQCVLLVLYEITKDKYAAGEPVSSVIDYGGSYPASRQEIANFLNRLERDLDAGRFFREEGLRPTMIRNIQSFFTRADITEQEVRTLHGMLSALRGNKTRNQ